MKSLKKWVVLLLALAFALSVTLAFAAEKKGSQWFVIKDSKGVCKVIQSGKDKTPASIAGPFATKELAAKAKAEKCPPKEKKK
ncbi:MAG: hypothetical protein FJ118_14315 [Deltaproteobacteria bacterium]|nr:hypothetical protein [Deltaproteobacteria bacterium]